MRSKTSRFRQFAVQMTSKDALDAEALIALCFENPGKFKVAKHVEFTDVLLRNAAGKVLIRI